jgi:hypothetical protein
MHERFREKHETLMRQADLIRAMLLATGDRAPALAPPESVASDPEPAT